MNKATQRNVAKLLSLIVDALALVVAMLGRKRPRKRKES